MAYNTSDNFNLLIPKPLDDRLFVADISARNAIATPYTTLKVYVASENKTYEWKTKNGSLDWHEVFTFDVFTDLRQYFQASANFSITITNSSYPYGLVGATNGSFRAQGMGDTSPIVSPVRLNGYSRLTLNVGTGNEHVTVANYEGGSINSNSLYAQNSQYLYGYSWIGLRQNWALQNSVATITGFINQNGWTFTNGYQTRSSGYYFYIFPNSGDPNNTFRYQLIASAGSGFTTTVTPSSNTITVGNSYLFEVVLNLTASVPYAEYFINGVSVGTITTNINNSSILSHVAIGSSRFTGTGSGTTYVIDCGFAGFRQKYISQIPFSSFYLQE